MIMMMSVQTNPTITTPMTIGTMRGLADRGLRVPNDVALVGHGDLDWSDVFSPHLTTMAQNVTVMGQRAVELLLNRIADPTAEIHRVSIKPTLVHRTSCGCPQIPA